MDVEPLHQREHDIHRAVPLEKRLERGRAHDKPPRDGQARAGHAREARAFSAGDGPRLGWKTVERSDHTRPGRNGTHSSMIATARTGAAVVLTHLTGNTLSVNPCAGSLSRFVMFSRW